MFYIGDPAKKEQGSVYMVFPYMDHDLAGLLENPSLRLTTPQVKTYIKQLLEGTAYLHHVSILIWFLNGMYTDIFSWYRTRSFIATSKVINYWLGLVGC